jgi:hypothetical protein
MAGILLRRTVRRGLAKRRADRRRVQVRVRLRRLSTRATASKPTGAERLIVHQLTLQGLESSAEDGPRRDSDVPEALRDARYRLGYDATTLFYDCVHSARSGGYVFTAPPFRNLWPLFCAQLRVDGRPLRGLRRRSAGRSDQVVLKAPAGASLSLDDGTGLRPVPVRPSLDHHFAGTRIVAAINRNNDLTWIREWAGYHAHVHGADAAVLFDNNSTDYAPQDIASALQTVPGLRVAAVVRAPYRYGLKLETKGQTYRLQYLQTAVLNIARMDVAARARSVLSCDIDELVLDTGGGSVFAAAERSLVGAVQVKGAWVYPARVEDIPCAQHAHGWRAVPDRSCMPKWCATPGGLLSRVGGWNVHAVGGPLRGLLRPARGLALAHCAGTTTAWKPQSHRFGMPATTAPDPDLVAATAKARASLG